MSTKTRRALQHLGWVAAAGLVSALAGYVASPEHLNFVSTTNAILVSAVLTPIFSSARKFVMDKETETSDESPEAPAA